MQFVERVSSRQNALVKRFRALAQERDPREPHVLLDGAHLIEEALTSSIPIEIAAFAEEAAAGRLSPLVQRLERTGARTIAVAGPVFDSMSPVQHPSGVVAIGHLAAASLDDVMRQRPALLLLLDGVQDPGNLGAIIRAAEACGATGVIVGVGSADAFGWKALRGAMGSSLRVPIVPRAVLTDAISLARAENIRVFAAVPRNGTPLPECDLRSSAAIILGGEGAGLSPDLAQSADVTLTIPMQAPVESLNVAIASALVLYEASRQRANVAVR